MVSSQQMFGNLTLLQLATVSIAATPCLRLRPTARIHFQFLIAVDETAYYHHDAKGPQHYIDHLIITLLVLLRCNSDVS